MNSSAFQPGQLELALDKSFNDLEDDEEVKVEEFADNNQNRSRLDDIFHPQLESQENEDIVLNSQRFNKVIKLDSALLRSIDMGNDSPDDHEDEEESEEEEVKDFKEA